MVNCVFTSCLPGLCANLDSVAVVHVSTPIGYGADRQAELAQARERLNALWQTMPLR